MTTTVLVVEDETKLRELLRSYSSAKGWSSSRRHRVARQSTWRGEASRISSFSISGSPTFRGKTWRRTCAPSWTCPS